ncbi:MAG: hypothetical protein ABIF77_17925, partial [bacterium]
MLTQLSKKVVFAAVLLSSLAPCHSYAARPFDDLRDGFVFGAGVGFGPMSNWTADTRRTSQISWSEDHYGWAWQMFLGAGRGRTIFGLEAQTSYSHSDLVDAGLHEVFLGPVWYQYIGPSGKSPVLMWGIGADIFHSPDMWSDDGPPAKPSANDIGWAWMVGAGYEFRPHWQVS